MDIMQKKIESGEIVCHGGGCCEYYPAEVTGTKPVNEMYPSDLPTWGTTTFPDGDDVYQFMLNDPINMRMHTGIRFKDRVWHIYKTAYGINEYMKHQAWTDFQYLFINSDRTMYYKKNRF